MTDLQRERANLYTALDLARTWLDEHPDVAPLSIGLTPLAADRARITLDAAQALSAMDGTEPALVSRVPSGRLYVVWGTSHSVEVIAILEPGAAPAHIADRAVRFGEVEL